jgi:hypothetical protein
MPVSTIQNASLASGVPGRANLPTGSVLQVAQTVLTTTTSTTSGTFVDITGMSASITPTSSSSKILVLVDAKFSASSASAGSFIKLLRGSTDIYVGTSVGSSVAAGYGFMPNGAGNFFYGLAQMSSNFLDSPATTSSTTYKLQWYTYSGGTCYINQTGSDGVAYNPRTASSITLLEIAA